MFEQLRDVVEMYRPVSRLSIGPSPTVRSLQGLGLLKVQLVSAFLGPGKPCVRKGRGRATRESAMTGCAGVWALRPGFAGCDVACVDPHGRALASDCDDFPEKPLAVALASIVREVAGG